MSRDLNLQVRLEAIDKMTGPLRKIMQGSSGLARVLRTSRDQVKALNQQQRDVTGYRQANIEIVKQTRAIRDLQIKTRGHTELLKQQQAAHANLKANLSDAKTQYNKLSKALIDGKGNTAEFHRELEKAQIKMLSAQQAFTRSASSIKTYQDRIRHANEQLGKLDQQHRNSQDRLVGYKKRLDEVGISTDGLGRKARAMRAEQERLNGVLEKQQAKLAAIAKARASYDKSKAMAGNLAGNGAAAMASGAAMSLPLAAMVGAYAPAEDAATQLKVSMMDATGAVSADFAKVTALATQLGDRLPGTTAEFQAMMTMLLKQGISAKSVLGGTGEAAAYLGVQLKLPAEQAAEFAANMQDATGTVESDMMGLMDMIQKTANLGVKPDAIIQGFSKMSPAMSLLKQRGLQAANTLAPLLAMMTQAGMAGESAGNAIRKVFESGLDLDKVAKANKALKKQGITLDFTNGKGDFGGLEKLFGQLEKLKGLNDTAFTDTVKEIFGDDAETKEVVSNMMRKGLAGYQEVADKLKAQADLRMRVNEQLKTLTNVMDAAQGSWTNAMAEFGAAVAPELKSVINWLGSMANGVGAWARENPKLVATLVTLTAGVAALSTAGGTLAIGIAGLIGPFAMAKLAMATFSITSGIALGPILAVIAAAAALAGGAYLIWNNWGTLGPKFTALLDGIKVAFSATMDWFAGLPARFFQFGGDILRGLAGGITAALGSVKDAVVGAGESAIGWFKEKLGIHSPSRVFAELGGHTMAGLEQGIQTGQKNPFAALDQTTQGVVKMGKEISAANPFAALDSAAKSAPKPASAGNPFAALDSAAKAAPKPASAGNPFAALDSAAKAAPKPASAGNPFAALDSAAKATPKPASAGNPFAALGNMGKTAAAAGALAAGIGAAAMPAAASQGLISMDSRPALAAPRQAPASGGQTFNFNVTINAAHGANASELAASVRSEVERLMREQGVRQRSALYDLD